MAQRGKMGTLAKVAVITSFLTLMPLTCTKGSPELMHVQKAEISVGQRQEKKEPEKKPLKGPEPAAVLLKEEEMRPDRVLRRNPERDRNGLGNGSGGKETRKGANPNYSARKV